VRIIPATERHFQWISEKLDNLHTGDEKGIVAESDNGEILGVAVLNTWVGSSVQVHLAIATPMCFRRHIFIKEVFNYIYNTAGRLAAIAMVGSNNKKAMKLNKHIGFTEVGRIRDGVRSGEDIMILEMHRDDCAWIKFKEEAA